MKREYQLPMAKKLMKRRGGGSRGLRRREKMAIARWQSEGKGVAGRGGAVVASNLNGQRHKFASDNDSKHILRTF